VEIEMKNDDCAIVFGREGLKLVLPKISPEKLIDNVPEHMMIASMLIVLLRDDEEFRNDILELARDDFSHYMKMMRSHFN